MYAKLFEPSIQNVAEIFSIQLLERLSKAKISEKSSGNELSMIWEVVNYLEAMNVSWILLSQILSTQFPEENLRDPVCFYKQIDDKMMVTEITKNKQTNKEKNSVTHDEQPVYRWQLGLHNLY